MWLQCLWTWLDQSDFRETLHFINELSQCAFITWRLQYSVSVRCQAVDLSCSRTQLFLQMRSEILIEAITVTPAAHINNTHIHTDGTFTCIGYFLRPYVYTRTFSALLICGLHQPSPKRNCGKQHATLRMNSIAGNFLNISLWQPVKPNFIDTES